LVLAGRSEHVGEQAMSPSFSFPVARSDGVPEGASCGDGDWPEFVVGKPAVGVLQCIIVACQYGRVGSVCRQGGLDGEQPVAGEGSPAAAEARRQKIQRT